MRLVIGEGSCGIAAGASKVRNAIESLMTGSDAFTLGSTGCIGMCFLEPIVDMYEGGFYHSRGIYRSEANSCMNNNVPYYSAISRQEMVERIMRYAGLEFSLEDFYARDVRDASNNDFVTTPSALSAEMTPAQQRSASKQMPPRFMGERPVLE